MKILHIINNLATGGAENIISNMIPLLNENIDKVDVLLLTKTESIYINHLIEKGVNIRYTNVPKMYSIKQIKEIRKIIDEYDIVHSHLFPTQYWLIISSIFKKKTPKFITTEHNTYNRRRKIKIFKYIDKYIYSKYDIVISNSKETESNLINFMGVRSSKYRIIDNGVPLNKFKKSKPYHKTSINENINEDDILVIQIARFNYEKDQKTTITAFSMLDDKYKLILVGDGDLRGECESYVKQLNLSHRVYFLGIRKDVPELIKTCDICVVSSFIEGFGLTAVESMASGKPVVASNVNGLNSVVENAELLFEVGNAEELKLKIEQLSQNKEYYRKTKYKCEKRAENFNIDRMVESHLEVYNEVLKK